MLRGSTCLPTHAPFTFVDFDPHHNPWSGDIRYHGRGVWMHRPTGDPGHAGTSNNDTFLTGHGSWAWPGTLPGKDPGLRAARPACSQHATASTTVVPGGKAHLHCVEPELLLAQARVPGQRSESKLGSFCDPARHCAPIDDITRRRSDQIATDYDLVRQGQISSRI